MQVSAVYILNSAFFTLHFPILFRKVFNTSQTGFLCKFFVRAR